MSVPVKSILGLLLLLDHDSEVVPHEPGAHLQHLVWLGGGQQDDLGLLVLILGHIVYLHPSAQHVGGLVLDELADVAVIPGTNGSLIIGTMVNMGTCVGMSQLRMTSTGIWVTFSTLSGMV